MKHFPVLFVSCLFAAVTLQQHKAVYRIKIHRAVYPRMSKEYAEGRVWISKPTRYTNAVNGEFWVHRVPDDTTIKMRVYEFFHNEYRPFAINLERRLCHFMQLEYRAIFYPDLLKIGAVAPEPRCPVKPGNYSFANFIPDDTNYPAALPFHNFMLEIGYWHGAVEMSVLQFYGTMDRDAVIREQFG